MNTSTALRTTIAAGVAGLGLSVGAIAMATAADETGGDSSMSADDRGFGRGPGHPGMMAGHRGALAEDLAEDLADELGVSEDELEDALEAVRDELRPDNAERPSEPPSDAEREARRAAFAKALAEELGISEAKVTAALEKLHDAREAEGRALLAERLDAAVEDGDLTTADKASVLKAYDAGVIGGPGLRHGPR